MIVGLTGKKQAGKNAAAKLLRVYSPLPVVEVSFAALLKQSAAAVLGVTVDDLEAWKNDDTRLVAAGQYVEGIGFIPEKGCQTVRSYLQRYGTEGHRDLLGPDFWVDAALPLDKSYGDALYVVTDVRFPNEAQRVKDIANGYVVRVTGPAEVEESGDTHASETPLPQELVDHELDNTKRDDNFAALDVQVRSLLRWLDLTPKRTAEAWPQGAPETEGGCFCDFSQGGCVEYPNCPGGGSA